jgi:hypothetical protein
MNKFALPVLLIIVSLGLFITYIDPAYKDLKILRSEGLQYDKALNSSKELRGIRDILSKRYNSFSDNDLSRIKKLLPDNIDNVRLVIDVDNIASKYGITIRGVKIETVADIEESKIVVSDNKDYEFVILRFTMSSSYQDFISFITDLKDSLRLVDIVDLDFTVPSQGSNLYTYNLGVKTYWLK